MLNPLLDINLVDFNDPADIAGFATLLCNLGSRKYNSGSAAERNEIRLLARAFVQRLDSLLPRMTPSGAFRIITAYNVAHCFAYGQAADPAFVNGYVLKAFDSMLHGDTSVDHYDMYRQIATGLQRRDKAYFDKPLSWNCISEERWYRRENCTDTGVRLDYDSLSRASILLRADLFAYEGRNAEAYKTALAARYRADDAPAGIADCKTVLAMEQFTYAAARYMPSDEFTGRCDRISRQLLRCHDLNRFVRASLQ